MCKLFGYISFDPVLFYNYLQIKNIISVYFVRDASITLMSNSGNFAFLTNKGKLGFTKTFRIEDITFPFDKEIVYIKSNNTSFYLITKNGCAYSLSSSKKFHYNKLYHNVKSIHCHEQYTIFLLKDNTIKFWWQ